jgi:peptidoglycan/xylan/chitin deacetylase (PgdA/CDA1 family)
MSDLFDRAVRKSRRLLAARFKRRDVLIGAQYPIISFSFDDAPISAFRTGGEILSRVGGRATYYISMGLLGTETETGRIADRDCLRAAVSAGHELGCHTFHHLDAWRVSRNAYISSVDANRTALEDCLPGYRFRSFAYPKSGARFGVKAELARRFDCCRGGGQTFNCGVADLNLLNACFIDAYAKADLDFLHDLIARTVRARGWLILAAHDISHRGTPFSCSPAFFSDLVRCAAGSGASLIPVGEACAKFTAT